MYLRLKPLINSLHCLINVPGSKSLTNRAVILSSLSITPLTLEEALLSEDSSLMTDSLRSLGIIVRNNEAKCSVWVLGEKGRIPNEKAELCVGNAGTVARFITALVALKDGGVYLFDGYQAMRKRPMKSLTYALQNHESFIVNNHKKKGHFPFTLYTRVYLGGHIKINVSYSSQFLSALLIIAPFAKHSLTIEYLGKIVSYPFIHMTIKIMEQFFCNKYMKASSTFCFHPINCRNLYPDKLYFIEPDATAASYFLLLPWLINSSIVLLRCCNNITLQGDIRFIDTLDYFGSYSFVSGRYSILQYSRVKPYGFYFDFNSISDTFLSIAAIMPLQKCKATILGICHASFQETDRITAMATELRKLGLKVKETKNSFSFVPELQNIKHLTAPITINTYKDHRIAMSFSILGCSDLHGDGRPWLTINDPFCCIKTFTNFFSILENIRKESYKII